MNPGELASVNGLRMYNEVHGAGRPLVLLHGGLLTIELAADPASRVVVTVRTGEPAPDAVTAL